MTVLITHPCDGTVGQPVNVTTEGFTKDTGTLTYVSGGVSGQAVEFAGGALNNAQDNYASAAGYVGLYIRVPTAWPSATLMFGRMDYNTSPYPVVCAARLDSGGHVVLSSGGATVVATSTTTLTVGQWFRIEWYAGASTQELRIFSPETATTPTETLTGATNSGFAPTKYVYGQADSSPASTAADLIDLDQIVLADDWPNMGTPAPSGTPTVRGVIQSGAEVPATVRGVIQSGSEVSASVLSVVGGGAAPAESTFPLTFPFTLS